MTTPADDEDELTALYDANFDRIDGVGAGANGIPRWLIAKQDGAGLMDPDFIRELVTKAEPDASGRERVTMPSGITVTGSPADIAAFIHKAAQRPARNPEPDYEQVIKAKYSAEDRRKMAGNGQAMKDESYPIADKDDLTNAIHAVGRGGSSHDAIRKHIISRARSLGASSEIPDNWAADGSLKEDTVSKADGATITKAGGPDMDQGIDGLDPTVPLAAPGEMAPGDPMVPGSPAWESIDAATACKWMSIAARLKNALCTLAERELIEAAVADPGDASEAWDLQDAMCAVDYVIDTLACFAAGEQAEVDLAADTMAAIGKALGSFDVGPLEAVEGLAPIAKAGRVLSAANEAAIRTAHDSLQKVLMSLPQAPAADDVQKEAAVAADQTSTEATGTAPADVAKAEGAPAAPQGTTPPVAEVVTPAQAAPVTKADGASDAPCVVYDGKGQPLGIVDMASITAIQGAAPAMGTMAMEDAKPDGEGPDMGAEVPADPAEPAEPADAAVDPAAADPCDMTPQPADDAGTKADEVTKAGTEPTITITHGELESTVAKAVAAAFDARAEAEGIAKSGAAAVLGEVETLKERLAIVEGQPAMPKVFTNGAVPPPDAMRGQDQAPTGGQPVDVAKAAALKNQLYKGTGPEQKQAFDEMQQMAVDGLAALHRR